MISTYQTEFRLFDASGMDLLPDSEMIFEKDPYIRSERTY